jgi:hypothetical protein
MDIETLQQKAEEAMKAADAAEATAQAARNAAAKALEAAAAAQRVSGDAQQAFDQKKAAQAEAEKKLLQAKEEFDAKTKAQAPQAPQKEIEDAKRAADRAEKAALDAANAAAAAEAVATKAKTDADTADANATRLKAEATAADEAVKTAREDAVQSASQLTMYLLEKAKWNLKIKLLDATDLQPLRWKTVKSVNVTIPLSCGDSEPCPLTVMPHSPNVCGENGNVAFWLMVKENADLRVMVEVTFQDETTGTSELVATSVACGQMATAYALVRSEATTTSSGTADVTLEAYQCPTTGGQRGRSRRVRIKQASAIVKGTPIEGGGFQPNGGQSQVSASVLDGVAYFRLQRGNLVEIDASFEEREFIAESSLPLLHLVPDSGNSALKISCTTVARKLRLFFVDSTGAATSPDVSIEGGSELSISNGVCTISDAKTGRMRLIATGADLYPSEINVDENMLQGQVIEVRRKVSTTLDREDDLIFDFAVPLTQDDLAFVRVRGLDGKVHDILQARGGELLKYSAPSDQPVMLEAVVNGREVGSVIHKPKGLPAAAGKN